MNSGETVFSGAEHPGTELTVLSSPAGFYVGYLDNCGLPYTRETIYFQEEGKALDALQSIEDAFASSDDVRELVFVR